MNRSLVGLLLVAAVLWGATAAPLALAIEDHLECFKIKDDRRLLGTIDFDAGVYGFDDNCRIAKAKYYCAPAASGDANLVDKKTGAPVVPLSITTGPAPGARLCYAVKCPDADSAIVAQGVVDPFGEHFLTRLKAKMVCTPAYVGADSGCYRDLGDGTVMDHCTGLQWEKKTDDGSIHDKDNLYTWTSLADGDDTDPDGTAFTDFIGALNTGSSDGVSTTGCFAEKCDWRMASLEELRTLVDLSVPGCGPGTPCTSIPGETGTVTDAYWTASGFGSVTSFAWKINFSSGGEGGVGKDDDAFVRAVRGP